MPLPHGQSCSQAFSPVHELLSIIGDKWSVLIIIHLSEQGVMRFSELHTQVEGISKRILSLKLQNLEQNGFVHRQVKAHYPPRVEYTLSDLGQALRPPLMALAQWAIDHHAEVSAARESYFQAQEERAPWIQEKSS